MTLHVDTYVISLDSQPQRTKHRWDSPALPFRSEYTHAPYWQGDIYFTAPHEDGQCDDHIPNIS